jgi:hypothetical protein
MPADLYVNENGTVGYAGRRVAWHRDGTVNPNAETMKELAISAGADFEYMLMPTYFEQEINGQTYAIQRKNRAVTINGVKDLDFTVSPDFEYHQPMELAEVMDQILTTSKDWGVSWKPESALVLGKGETTCFCISLGNQSIGGKEVECYLIVTDTLDGRHSLVPAIVPIVTVCSNTLRMALQEAMVKLNVRHTKGHQVNFRRNVESILESQGKIYDVMNALAHKEVNEKIVKEYLDKLFAPPEKEDLKVQSVVKKLGMLKLSASGNYYRMVEENKEPQTAWTMFNAAQEAVEHSNLISREKTTVKALLTGRGEVVDWITDAFKLAQRW